jgi:hypothetical protein
MKLTINSVYTFKLNSGEEVITKVLEVDGDEIVVHDPLSIAPGPQGMGLMPSLFTAEQKTEARLNTNNIAIYALTDANVKSKYIEATTGIKIPDKKLVLG